MFYMYSTTLKQLLYTVLFSITFIIKLLKMLKKVIQHLFLMLIFRKLV